MNHGTRLTIDAQPNGSTIISNDQTTINIQPDGTVSISTFAPLQLTGASLAKLDDHRIGSTTSLIIELLGKRLVKQS